MLMYQFELVLQTINNKFVLILMTRTHTWIHKTAQTGSLFLRCWSSCMCCNFAKNISINCYILAIPSHWYKAIISTPNNHKFCTLHRWAETNYSIYLLKLIASMKTVKTKFVTFYLHFWRAETKDIEARFAKKRDLASLHPLYFQICSLDDFIPH